MIFRLTQDLALILIDLIYDRVVGQTSAAVPLHLQVLAVLRFMAEGGFQKGAGNDYNHPLSQTSVSWYINKVTDAIISISDRYLHFPQTRAERMKVKNRYDLLFITFSQYFNKQIFHFCNIFCSFFRFLEFNSTQNILGIIDCFLVSTIRQKENEEAFHNYKYGSSLICQAVRISKFLILIIRNLF